MIISRWCDGGFWFMPHRMPSGYSLALAWRAPEGVAAMHLIRALGGDMQARLIPRNEGQKGDTEENRKIAAEIQRCRP